MSVLDELQQAGATALANARDFWFATPKVDQIIGIAIIAILFAIFVWLFVPRRPPSKNDRAPNVLTTGFRRYQIWRLGSWTWASIYDGVEPSPVPPIVHHAHRSGRIPKAASRRLQELIQPTGADALILRDAVNPPAVWRSKVRADLRSDHEAAARWAHSAMKQVMCYMATLGIYR